MKNFLENNITLVRKKKMKISLLVSSFILICLTLSACRKQETVFENTASPRSMYDESTRQIYNDYTGIKILLPEGWYAENNANNFAIRANFSKEQKEFLKLYSYENVSLIPDFTMGNNDNGDTITVFYRNLSTEEYSDMNAESFIGKYIMYYARKNNDIRGHQSFRQKRYPNSSIPVYDNNYDARESGSVVIDGIDFTIVTVDAPYRGEDSYEYAAFADYEDYVICIVASTDSGTSADEFWEMFHE